ncbi:MAG: acetylglutamate kinase [Solobacterium sp.]|nr:acetylglutamate kinase [Solobacterium sp.]
MITNMQRAEVLIQALPYLNDYVGETIVVKYGGNAMTDETLKQQVMEDIVLLWKVGIRVVLVHGGGPELSELMMRLGKKPAFVDGLRVTDKETIDLAQMVLAGKINKSLVNMVQAKGGKAIGLSGMDGRLIEAKIRNPKYGYVGDVTKINANVIEALLNDGYIPVISTLGCDEEGNTYNINGDTAAGKIASTLQAKKMILLTDIEGVLKDKNDPESLISHLTLSEAKELIDQNIVSGGMIPKISCCTDAIEEGLNSAVILDGRVSHAILMEIFTNEGAGTLIEKE